VDGISFLRSLSGTMWHSKQNDSLVLEEARLVEWMEMYRKLCKPARVDGKA
ncbi:hypothetical protein Tco_0275213, partial [Tanacetum coccineum]